MDDEDAILNASVVYSEQEILAEFQESCEAEAPGRFHPQPQTVMRPFNLFLGSEPLSKLTRGDERLDHFGVNEVAVELVELP